MATLASLRMAVACACIATALCPSAPAAAGPQPGKAVVAQPLRALLHHRPAALRTLQSAGVARADRARVRVSLTRTGPDVLAELRSAGLEIERYVASARAARGWIAVSHLGRLAAVPAVRRIDIPDRAVPQVGLVDGEHDALLRCAEAREVFGLTGAGIRIGVISDGVDSLQDAQATGDAPAVTVPQHPTCHRGAGDEGTAMIEMVHDCAPGAEIGFCGPGDDLEMVECIRCLRDVYRADVIVDDLGFLLQPYFADGPIATEVDATAAAGVLYVTAAGNFAEKHYQGRYTPCGAADPRHRFGPDSCALRLTSTGPALVVLQWDDPPGASGRDYDLCVDGCDGRVCSEELQDGDDDPLEYVLCRCPEGETCDLRVEVSRFSGPEAEIEILALPISEGGRIRDVTPAVPADSIFGHACARGAVAVAAIDAADAGNDEVEPFSSRGPCTVVAPEAERRDKPDLSGIDGVRNTRPGGFPSPFFGTSAAAPGVAAVAALLAELEPGASADAIRDALAASAVDIEEPGFDFASGMGRVDALGAAAALRPPPTPTPTPTRGPTPTPGLCVADCDRNGTVSIAELVSAVAIALDREAVSECPEADADGDGRVAIPELVQAVTAALAGCAGWP